MTTKNECGVTPGCTHMLGLDDTSRGGRRKQRRPDLARAHDLQTWLQCNEPRWTWNWRHQELLYKKLREVSMGSLKRLMIMMPPRHGKSELVTVRYVAYRLTREPTLNVIVGSYNQRLANRFSRKIRNVWAAAAMSPAIGRPASATPSAGASSTPRLQEGSLEKSSKGGAQNARPRSAEEWETAEGGGVRAVGVGAGVTGFGARLVVIDDPVKNRAEAESEAYRGRVWDWFNDDIYTRLEPDAAVILIQTRWHEDDLAGRLISEMENGGERWEIVSLPAIAEGSAAVRTDADRSGDTPVPTDAAAASEPPSIAPNAPDNERRFAASGDEDRSVLAPSTDPLNRRPGEALCPERYDEAALERIKRKLGSYSFAALYQQRPVPSEGGMFKREWFSRVIDIPPDGLRWVRAYDLAVSTRASADYTASFRCAMDSKGNIYIADGFRGRIEFPDQRRLIVEKMLGEKDTTHCIEQALHGTAIVQDLRREGAVAHVPLRACRVDADKVTRALAWANRAEEGKIILVRGRWIADFLDEVTSFPHGRHDDQIDAVSLAISMLSQRRRESYAF